MIDIKEMVSISLVNFRNYLGKDQKEFYEEFETSQGTGSKYESGVHLPPLDLIYSISNKYLIPIDELLRFPPDPCVSVEMVGRIGAKDKVEFYEKPRGSVKVPRYILNRPDNPIFSDGMPGNVAFDVDPGYSFPTLKIQAGGCVLIVNRQPSYDKAFIQHNDGVIMQNKREEYLLKLCRPYTPNDTVEYMFHPSDTENMYPIMMKYEDVSVYGRVLGKIKV